MKIIAVIPARYGSERFPGKPLCRIGRKPMIQWVYEAVSRAVSIQETLAATDDKRIYECVRDFGGRAIMTGACSCGTERVWEAIRDTACDVVMNIQGDEPLIRPEVIDALAAEFTDRDVQMATMRRKLLDPAEAENPNVVKVICNDKRNAVYFSRYAVPFRQNPDWHGVHWAHIGIYAYRKPFLERYISMKPSEAEQAERLEQLRVLEHGYPIRVVETEYEGRGVDVPDDIRAIEEILKKRDGFEAI